jgi:acyl-CoA synthetase (AMP-forming)/AMP-acid ligase II/acyl carrier protein
VSTGFAQTLEQYGTATALLPGSGAAISYAELAALADASAAPLGPDRVLLVLPMQADVPAVAAYLGAIRAGHVPILAPAGGKAELEALARHYGARAIFDGEVWRTRAGAPHVELYPDLALLLQTSGSTGAPKLVRLSHRNIASNAAAIAEYLNIGPQERAITTLPLHYSYGLSVLNSHLHAGASLVLTGASVARPEFWDQVQAHSATSLAGVPYTYELLESIGFREHDYPTLRTMTQAGGRLGSEMAARYVRWAEDKGVRFFIMYGQTEATARIAYLPPEQARGNESAIGRAIPGGTLKLVSDAGQEITAPSTPGELVYRGPNVMLGYAEASADLSRGAEVEDLRTGDIAERTASGLFRIVGRTSRFCKPYGIRTNLDGIEQLLRSREIPAAVSGSDELIVMAYEGEHGPAEIVALLAEQLGLPASLFVALPCAKVPRLSSGKPDYAGILASGRAVLAAKPPARAADLLDLFSATFTKGEVAPASSFISLGGDSLNYVLLSGELQDRLGFLPDDWERMSIAELAELERSGRASPPRWFARLDADILLRALAMLVVVYDHSRDVRAMTAIQGGSELLLLLAGFSLGRFKHEAFAAGRFWNELGALALKLLLPFYLLLILYAASGRTVEPDRLLLVSNFFGRYEGALEPLWFLETLLHINLALALLALSPGLRAVCRENSFRFGALLVLIGVALRMLVPLVTEQSALGGRTVDQLFVLLAFGWWLGVARAGGQRAWVFTCALAFTLVARGGENHLLLMLAGVGLLAAVRSIPVPAPCKTAALWIAAASLMIYFTHSAPIWAINTLGGVQLVWPKLILALVLGVACHQLALRLSQLIGWQRAGAPNVRNPAEAVI